MTINHIDQEVDARGLRCPLPILRAKKALALMQSGQILKVVATDPSAPSDFAAFARHTGNTLLETHSQEGEHTLIMQRR